MASVRGIGVAVIISMCGSSPSVSSLLRSASRCATPKRCCSSMMASANWWNSTLLWMMACVPTTSRASPEAINANIARRSLVFWVPVSQAVVTPNGSSQPSNLRKCCSARISVGAISAHCHPASMHKAAASAATTVFPAPTSPCKSRCMGLYSPRSAPISVTTRCCAPVSVKGNTACSRWYSEAGPETGASTGARSAARSRRLCSCESCCASNSSALSRCQAGWLWSSNASSDASGVGWCKNARASRSVQMPPWPGPFSGAKSSGGKVSPNSARARPDNTALRKYACGRPATVGYTGVSAAGSGPPALS